METVSEIWKQLEATLLPTLKQMKEALGGNKDIKDKRIQLAFSEDAIKGRFEKMTIEETDDWIPSMKNKGQPFSSYVSSKPNKVFENKKTIYVVIFNNLFLYYLLIYILALDKSISEEFLENCSKYWSAFFFGLPVKVLDNIDINELGVIIM